MDFSTKRYYKKMAKMYFTFAWILAIMWMLYIAIGVILIIVTPYRNQPPHVNDHSFLIFSCLLFPLIWALVFGYIGQEYTNKRIRYKRQINEYRQRRFFTKAITLLRRGNISEAIYIFDELLIDRNYRKFILPFIICENTHSIEDNIHTLQ
jgi:hypothetical protein